MIVNFLKPRKIKILISIAAFMALNFLFFPAVVQVQCTTTPCNPVTEIMLISEAIKRMGWIVSVNFFIEAVYLAISYVIACAIVLAKTKR